MNKPPGGLASMATLPVFALLLLLPAALFGQAQAEPLAAQSLRAYWHVFIAYALAWVLVFGWLFSIARRLARVERSLEQ